MLFRKTPTSERGNYRYHSATGETFVITPEEVEEENIRLLQASVTRRFLITGDDAFTAN